MKRYCKVKIKQRNYGNNINIDNNSNSGSNNDINQKMKFANCCF